MRDFMKLSRNGDAVSQKILKDAAFYLGITISNLIKILEPKMVLIASCEPLRGQHIGISWKKPKKISHQRRWKRSWS